MALRQFHKGERVVVNRGDGPYRNRTGTVETMNPETGTTEVMFDGDEIPAFISNGNLQWESKIKPTAKAVPGTLTVEGVEALVGPATASTPGPVVDTATTRECICGCGGAISKKAKGFRPGHDQTHKGNLIRIMQEGGPQAEFAESELLRLKWRTSAEIVELKNKVKPKAVPVSITA